MPGILGPGRLQATSTTASGAVVSSTVGPSRGCRRHRARLVDAAGVLVGLPATRSGRRRRGGPRAAPRGASDQREGAAPEGEASGRIASMSLRLVAASDGSLGALRQRAGGASGESAPLQTVKPSPGGKPEPSAKIRRARCRRGRTPWTHCARRRGTPARRSRRRRRCGPAPKSRCRSESRGGPALGDCCRATAQNAVRGAMDPSSRRSVWRIAAYSTRRSGRGVAAGRVVGEGRKRGVDVPGRCRRRNSRGTR